MNDLDIREIKTDIKEVLRRMVALECHVQNEAIHQLPPCEFHRVLSAKLWAIGVTAFTALAGALYNLNKGH